MLHLLLSGPLDSGGPGEERKPAHVLSRFDISTPSSPTCALFIIPAYSSLLIYPPQSIGFPLPLSQGEPAQFASAFILVSQGLSISRIPPHQASPILSAIMLSSYRYHLFFPLTITTSPTTQVRAHPHLRTCALHPARTCVGSETRPGLGGRWFVRQKILHNDPPRHSIHLENRGQRRHRRCDYRTTVERATTSNHWSLSLHSTDSTIPSAGERSSPPSIGFCAQISLHFR